MTAVIFTPEISHAAHSHITTLLQAASIGVSCREDINDEVGKKMEQSQFDNSLTKDRLHS